MAKSKKKFYVVWVGRAPGIYDTWSDCEAQTKGFANARFKSFPSMGEAEAAFGKKPGALPKKSVRSEKSKSDTSRQSLVASECDAYALFCDGGCDPNPGPSGTGMAVYIKGELHERWCGHHEVQGTNNRAELFGMLEALAYAKVLAGAGKITAQQRAVIYCDSQYAINCITKWVRSWRMNGWKTQKGDPVLNKEIIETASLLLGDLSNLVDVRKVKGHSGVPGNELADQLAGAARSRKVTGWSLESSAKANAVA